MSISNLQEDHPFSLVLPLVERGELDPWKVDIVELTNIYINELRKREILDLRIPAGAIVAAAFLLKKKIEVIFPKPERKPRKKRNYTLKEIVEMFEEEEADIKESIEKNIERIRKRIRRSPKKEISRKSSPRKKIPLHVSKFEDVLEEMMKFLGTLDIGKRIEFITFMDKINFVPQFMALMYLYFDGKINLYQEEHFGDIIIEKIS